MPDEFDPYYHWLGIPPQDRPLDHYRLLGLARFETDPVVIRAAADERMSLLHSVQSGPRSQYSQKLLNEVAAAKVCLLNDASRAAYDATLRWSQFAGYPTAAPVAVAIPAVPAPPVAPPPVVPLPVVPPPVAQALESPPPARASYWFLFTGAMLFVATSISCLILALAHLRDVRRESVPSSPPTGPITGLSPGPKNGLAQSHAEIPIVLQDGAGGIVFPVSVAEIHGERLAITTAQSAQVTANWSSLDDWMSWRFRVFSVPAQGVFRLLITYSADTDAADGAFRVAIDETERVCTVHATGTGEYRTDEYKIALRSSGEHRLSIRPQAIPGAELMVLKEVELLPLGTPAAP